MRVIYGCSITAAENGVYMATRSPPGIRRVPWPVLDDVPSGAVSMMKRSFSGKSPLSSWTPVLAGSSEKDQGKAEVVDEGFTGFVEMDFLQREDWNVTRTCILVHDVVSKWFALITGSGRVYTCRPSSFDGDPRIWVGELMHSVDYTNNVNPNIGTTVAGSSFATTASINGRAGILTVGTKSGAVYLYRMDTSPISDSKPAKKAKERLFRILPQPTRRLGHHRIAREVTSASWSSDGKVLAVARKGGRSGGLGLYAGFGRPLTDASLEPDLATDSDREAFFDGTRLLFWGEGDQTLFVWPSPDATNLPSTTPTVPSNSPSAMHSNALERQISRTSGVLHALAFASSIVAKSPTLDNASYAALCAHDRMVLYVGAGEHRPASAAEGDSPEALCLQIQFPTLYIAENWPIHYTALNGDGKLVAIAGKRGFAHYNVITQRWKMFLNAQQETGFSVVGGLVWYHDVLVAGCLDLLADEYQLRFYPKDTNLDNSNLMMVERLPARPLSINLLGESLTVYCADNMVYHYGLHVSSGSRVDLSLRQHVPLECIVQHPEQVASLCWFTLGLRMTALLVLVQGDLYLVNPHKADTGDSFIIHYERKLLTRECSSFYLNLRPEGGVIASIWAITTDETKVWPILARDTMLHDVLGLVAFEYVGIRAEGYHLTALTERGILFGLEQKAFYSEALGSTMFNAASKSQLYIHDILEHLLLRSPEEAMSFAKCHERHPYFAHALEVLLHRVLEKEADKDITEAEGALLPAVITLLRAFPYFLEVIVRCARKTEVFMWNHLFRAVGEPKELFEKCLFNNQLHTATAYLIVLQTLEPLTVNSEDSARLLERAIDARDFELCKEIVRFLGSISGSSGIDLEDLVASIETLDITDKK